MKEYIYLDTKLVNSYLAQLDEGVLIKMITGQDSGEENSVENGEEKELGFSTKAGIPGFAEGGGKITDKESNKMSTVFSENNSELIETALDDYSLDVLITKLKNENKLKYSSGNWNDGDIVITTNSFHVYNFELLRKSTEKEQLYKIIKEPKELENARDELKRLQKIKQKSNNAKIRIAELQDSISSLDPYSNFESVYKFASYAETLLPESIVFKIGKTFCIGVTDSLRLNIPLLAFLSQTSRKVNMLGIISSKKTKALAPEKGVQLESPETAANAPAILTDIILESFELATVGDYFVRPIAIYFDDEQTD